MANSKMIAVAPNALSLLRMILAFVVPYTLITESLFSRVMTAVVFTFAAFTDMFDGRIARRFNVISKFGKIIDPIADKILVLGTYITFSYLGYIPLWLLLPIVIREVAVTVVRFHFLTKGIAVAAERSGKLKTVIQMVGLWFVYEQLIYDAYLIGLIPSFWGTVFIILKNIVLIIVLYITIYSGVLFFISNLKLFKQ